MEGTSAKGSEVTAQVDQDYWGTQNWDPAIFILVSTKVYGRLSRNTKMQTYWRVLNEAWEGDIHSLLHKVVEKVNETMCVKVLRGLGEGSLI